jgi:signal transduction histidine kinase
MRCSSRIEPTCRNSRRFVLDQSSTGSGDDSWTGSGLTDMRRQSLRQVAIALLICGLVLIPLVPVVLGPTTNGPITVFTLLLGSFVTLILSDRHSRLAAWILIASLLALFGTVIFATGIPGIAFLLPQRMRLSETFLLWAATGLSWLALRPLLIALQWSWENYARVSSVNQLLQERQAELGLTVKSLNETLDRLDTVNHELDRARRAANQARQLKSEFAANVSHEPRSPFSG